MIQLPHAARLALLCAALLCVAAADAAAQQPFSFRLRPALVSNPVGQSAALGWDLSARTQSGDPDLASDWIIDGFARFSTDGALAWHPSRNPEALRARLAGGLSLHYDDGDFDSGLFDVGLGATLDADQRFDRVEGSGSLLLAYVHLGTGMRMLIPSWEAGFGAVRTIDAPEPLDAGWRFRMTGDATWTLRLDEIRREGPLSLVVMHANVRGFRDGTLDPGSEAPRDGLFGALAVGLALDALGGSVYLQRSGGTLPAASDRPRSWALILDLPAGRPRRSEAP